jgi:hypothetical protein
MINKMIRVTIEIVPFGNEGEKRKLGEITIVNDGTGTPEIGNYKVYYWKPETGTVVAQVKKYNRENGFLKLLQKCINKLIKYD